MIVFIRGYPFWFFVANWGTVACVLLVVVERILPVCVGEYCDPAYSIAFGQWANYADIPQQSWLLIVVLAITVFMIMLRGATVFFRYVATFEKNDRDESLHWLNEDEFNQRQAADRRKHRDLLESWLLTVGVFSCHYLVGMFVADVATLSVYMLLYWVLNIYCIGQMRHGYQLPLLSTYEFVQRTKIGVLWGISLAFFVIGLAVLLFGLWQQQTNICPSLVGCIPVVEIQSSTFFGSTLEGLQLLGTYPVIMLFVVLVLLLCLGWFFVLLLAFRPGVLSIYRTLTGLAVLAMLLLLLLEYIMDTVHIRVAMELWLLFLLPGIGVFFLRDVALLRPKDAAVYRSQTFELLAREQLNNQETFY